MKDLDHNTDCQHAIPSIYLFPPFPACFSFHNKDQILQSRNYFLENIFPTLRYVGPHSATYSADKQEYKTLHGVENHRNVIKTGTQKPIPP